jgi:hypothetical protein
MNEEAKSKTYKISYSDGRPDEIFELETESDCDHQLVSLGDVPSLPYGKSRMTRGGCALCGNTYVEETDSKDQHLAFYKKVIGSTDAVS